MHPVHGLFAWGYMSWKAIASYASGATTTSLAHEIHYNSQGVTFPSLSFCNTNSVDCRCLLWYDGDVWAGYPGNVTVQDYWCFDFVLIHRKAIATCTKVRSLSTEACRLEIASCVARPNCSDTFVKPVSDWIYANAYECGLGSESKELRRFVLDGTVTMNDVFRYGGYQSWLGDEEAINRSIMKSVVATEQHQQPSAPFLLDCHVNGVTDGSQDCSSATFWSEHLRVSFDDTMDGWCLTLDGSKLHQAVPGFQKGVSITLATNLAFSPATSEYPGQGSAQ